MRWPRLVGVAGIAAIALAGSPGVLAAEPTDAPAWRAEGSAAAADAGPAVAEAYPPIDGTSWVAQVRLTDGALYIGSVTIEDGQWTNRLWRRAAYRADDGVVLGNAELVSSELCSGADDFEVGEHAVVWRTFVDEAGCADLEAETDEHRTIALDGTSPVTRPVWTPVAHWFGYDAADSWYTAAGEVRTVDGRVALDLLAHAPAGSPNMIQRVAISETAVVWTPEDLDPDDLTSAPADDPLLLAALEEDGTVGTAQTLASGFHLFDVSDAFVAWSDTSTAHDSSSVHSLIWAPITHTSSRTTVVTGYGASEVMVDRDVYVGLRGWDSGTLTGVLEVYPSTDPASPVFEVAGLDLVSADLQGGLVAYAVDTKPGGSTGRAFSVRVASVEGTPVSTLRHFPDVAPDSAFLTSIDWLILNDITHGYSDGTYRPGTPISRGAFAAFLYRMAGRPDFAPPATSPFADVPTDSPFYTAITWLASQDIARGVERDGRTYFLPATSVSRGAMAAFLYRLSSSPTFTAPSPAPFDDVTASTKFSRAIEWFAATGIGRGSRLADGTVVYRPESSTTRGQMSAFLKRMTEHLDGA